MTLHPGAEVCRGMLMTVLVRLTEMVMQFEGHG